MNSVLIAGFTTRHVAQSAHRAGYTVYAVDNFRDQDLFWYVADADGFLELSDIPSAIDRMCRKHPIDGIILTSGAEDLLVTPVPRIGPSPACVATFLDKKKTQDFFDRNGFPAPKRLDPLRYPAMLKPCRGAGGWRNTVIRSQTDLRVWETEWPDEPYLVQEIIEGIPASVCCVCNGTHAMALAVNRQILRGGEEMPFGFAGSVTPFSHPMACRMATCAEDIVSRSGCKGLIGVDFIVTHDSFYVIEINPRFQATLDTVEMAMGCNLFSLHCDACAGTIPERKPKPKQVAIRRILFAPRDLQIDADLSCLFPGVSDIPPPGTLFKAGQAIISVYGWGEDEARASEMLNTTISRVTQYMR